MPWDALARRFKSNSAAASRLHADWKRRSPRAAREVSAGSLATKLGDLRRGKQLWWEKRPELTELLAELLECEVSDLLGSAATPVGLDFPEFPGLRPLAPNEAPCRLWSEGSLWEFAGAPLHLQGHGRWIHAPPGMGKSLAIRWLAAHGEPGSLAVSVRRLVEVAAHRNVMAPLFVEVGERDPTGDEEVLRTLAIRRAPTVVLAPFELPEPRLGGRSRFFPLDDGKRRKPRFTHTERERLLQWIDARLETSEGDTRMAADDVRAWLDHHDPHTQLVATPADLLALCFDFHVHGRDAITLGRRARRWLAGVTAARNDGDARIRTPVERTFIALCAAELTDRSLERGLLQAEDWEAHVPATVQRGEGPRSGAAVLVEHLREAGLLRGGAHGLDLAPTWVACGLYGEAARPLLEDEDAARWGLLAADATRRTVVDHILDQLSTAALLALVRAVVKGPATACPLGWLGAREATFAAAARRLEQPGFVLPDRDHAAWQQLAVLVIANLRVVQERRNVPHTRLDVDLWWSLTWLFSLRVPPPASLPEPGLGWYFPGWTQRLDFAELPRLWPWSNKVPDDPSPEVVRMVALASEVVARFPNPPPDVDWPGVLLPALLLIAPGRGWCLPPKVVSRLSGTWEERVFLYQASQLPNAQRAAIAALLWELAPRVQAPPNEVIPVSLRLARMKNTAYGLLPFILENLPTEVIERTIQTDGLCRSDVELNDLQLLPRRLRRSVVGTALAQPTPDTSRWLMARELAPLLDVEDIDLIVELVQQSEANTAAEFVGFLWTAAPECARREAAAAFQTRHPAASAWFHFAPRRELAPLLDLVDAVDGPLPEWLPAWARARVPHGGLMAERLHAVAHRAPTRHPPRATG